MPQFSGASTRSPSGAGIAVGAKRSARRCGSSSTSQNGAERVEASVILAVIYEKGNPRADLAMLQHRFDEIRTMLHTHLDEAECLQIFVAEGSTARLKELIAQLRRIKGVKVIKFIQTAARR